MNKGRLRRNVMGSDLRLPMVRIYYVVFVILIPVFLLAINPFSAFAEWQSGRWQDIWALWLSHKVHWIFWPMYVWAIVALIFLIKNFEENSKKIWVRWGIYVGTFWCWMYFMFELILFAPGIVVAVEGENISDLWHLVLLIGQGVLIWVGWHFREQLDYKKSLGIMLLLIVGMWSLSQISSQNSWMFAGLILVPVIATMLATKLSFKIYRIKNIKLNWKSVSAFWLYASLSLTESIFKLIAEYNKLPKTQPHCFIVTAATTGHSLIVGEKPTQLRNFEKFEGWLKLEKPYLHYRLRRIYNYAGPVIANIIYKNKFLADLTYILLKPVEWMCNLVK